MDGDIEMRPLIHRDEPTERAVHLFAPAGKSYDAGERQSIAAQFEDLQAKEPELIRNAGVGVDHEAGRLAVGLLVYGDHATLHGRVPVWLAVLKNDDTDTLGYAWRIDH